jgi:coenzyme F420 hydrogenase subunit beta
MTTAQPPHRKAKALRPGAIRPAKELCSECGFCDTYYIHYVKEACAFLNQQFPALETQSHGRQRDLEQDNEVYFGVHQDMMAARKQQPIEGAQWTGIVSSIAIEMLTQGKVEGVVCVQNTEEDRFHPRRPRQQAYPLAQPLRLGAGGAVGDEAAAGDWGRLPNPSPPCRAG